MAEYPFPALSARNFFLEPSPRQPWFSPLRKASRAHDLGLFLPPVTIMFPNFIYERYVNYSKILPLLHLIKMNTFSRWSE